MVTSPPPVFIRHKITKSINVTAFYTFHYHEYHPNFISAGEKHDFWEIVYIDRGNVFFVRDNEPEEIAVTGQCIFHKPNEFHRIRANKMSSANVFIITFECKSKAMRFFENKLINISKEQKQIFKKIFQEISDKYELPPLDKSCVNLRPKNILPSDNLQIIKLYLEILLITLCTQKPNTEIQTKPLAMETMHNEVIEFLKNNLYKSIKLEDICNAMHYKKSALTKQFKQTTNKTIFEYLTYLRIDEAKKLIRETNYTLYRISRELRFQSYSTFSKTFKKIEACTPSEYKKILKN